MIRAPHPMLAALYRAAGSAARLAGSVDRAEALVGALDATLGMVPLDDRPDWDALLAGPGASDQIGATLARLAAPDPGDPVAPRLSRAIGPVEASDGAGAPAPKSVTPFAPLSPVRAVEGDPDTAPKRPWPGDRPPTSAPHGSVRSPIQKPYGFHTVSIRDKIAESGPVSPSDLPAQMPPVLRKFAPPAAIYRSAARVVTVDLSHPRHQAVAQILAGTSVDLAGLSPDDATPLSISETRIATLLTRVDRPAAAPVVSSPARRASVPEIVLENQSIRSSAAPQTPAQPAPRNGLERLLVRAGKPHQPVSNIPAQPDPTGSPTTDAGTPMPSGPRHSQGPEDTRPVADPAAMAQALVTHLRKEARAAGIDLNGGTG